MAQSEQEFCKSHRLMAIALVPLRRRHLSDRAEQANPSSLTSRSTRFCGLLCKHLPLSDGAFRAPRIEGSVRGFLSTPQTISKQKEAILSSADLNIK